MYRSHSENISAGRIQPFLCTYVSYISSQDIKRCVVAEEATIAYNSICIVIRSARSVPRNTRPYMYRSSHCHRAHSWTREAGSFEQSSGACSAELSSPRLI